MLIVVSSGITTLIVRRGSRSGEIVTALQPAGGTNPAPTTARNATAVPISLAAAEQGYLASVKELQALFEKQRPRLTPETIAVVERSLAAIDVAIAEARAALLADPANEDLARLLGASYRQKVDLLRRAAEISQT